MAHQGILDASLQLSPMSVDLKCQLLKELWDIAVDPLHYYRADSDFDPYFRAYLDKCNSALYEGGRHISIRTHRDVIEIAQELRQGLSRDQIKPRLKAKLTSPQPNEDELLNSSIDLVIRLYLMFELGIVQNGFTGRTYSAWGTGSLEDFLSDLYKGPPQLGNKAIKLQEIFNARNLGRIAGLKIDWTKNLADHLRLVDDDKKVSIFHYRSFLEAQKNNTVFPDNFIRETLTTLSLLFPADQEIKKWFQKLARNGEYDTNVLRSTRLGMEDRQIDRFIFWHDRLVILKEFFDEAEPGTLSQWWHDRRERVQWYTFWVAGVVLMLTIFFGFVQSIEGALQVWKAFDT